MKFDIEALSAKLNKVDKELKKIDEDERIKKYGTFLDSKQDIIQLYMLFIFFGINMDVIQKFPYQNTALGPAEYDPD